MSESKRFSDTMRARVGRAPKKRVVVDPKEGKVRERTGEQKPPVEEQEVPELLENLDKAVDAIEGALSEVAEIRDELMARGEEAARPEKAPPEEEEKA